MYWLFIQVSIHLPWFNKFYQLRLLLVVLVLLFQGCIPKVEFRTTAVIREDLLGGAYDTYNTYKTYQPSEVCTEYIGLNK